MPIYEFHCRPCNTLFSFFSAAIATDARPACPKCRRQTLERRPSTFATLKRRGNEEGEEESPLDHLDEAKLEGAMASLAGEMEQLGDGEDPKQVGHLFRRFGDMTGLEIGPRMEDALRRLEAGEDLESVEADMDDDVGDGQAWDDFFQLKKAAQRRRSRPKVDDTLYFL